MTEDFGKNGPSYEWKKPGKLGVSAASLNVGPRRPKMVKNPRWILDSFYALSAIAENAASP